MAGGTDTMEWNQADLDDLTAAVGLLENPGLIAKVSDLVGTPIEYVLKALPKSTGDTIARVTQDSLMKAVNVAVKTMDPSHRKKPRSRGHLAIAGLAGGVGGAFGIVALPFELPITTTVIMRSIADIARSEGEDLVAPATRLACLEVFAMGGPTAEDDATESGYFAVRMALAQAVSEATKFVAKRAVVEEGAPVIVRLLAQIAARFNTVVGEKILAQGVPIVGALGGATINVLFIEHFQDMARGHFIVRRLERKYGEVEVRKAYGEIISHR
jgi:EcsC protein family